MVGAGSFKQLFRKILGNDKTRDVSIVAKRIVEAFNQHGIEITQIPRIFPALTLDNLATPEKLLSAITPEIIDSVAQLFGIRSQWLEGVDDEIYEYLSTYKAPEELLKRLSELRYPPGERLSFPLRVLTTHKHLDRAADEYQVLAPVLVEPIAELGEETIYRYHVYRDGFDWNHATSRIELKAIARIIFTKLHTPVPLFVVSRQDMENVLEGKTVPRDLFDGALITDPSLEDYAIPANGSCVAKETHEFSEVAAYIERLGLADFQFALDIEEVDASDARAELNPAPPEISSQKEKPRSARDNHWGPILAGAQAIWSQEPTLPIAEVVRRLRGVTDFKAARFTESAIHKRIVQMAPAGVRGKPGRKPKQSASMLTTLIHQQIEK